MKIRPSIRLYSFFAVLLTGITTIVVLSVLTMHYFFAGMDVALRDSMYSHAISIEARAGSPVQVSEFTIASQWKDLPKDVQDNIPRKSLELNKLANYFVGGSILSPPQMALFAMKVQHNGGIKYVSAAFYDSTKKLLEADEFPHFVVIFSTALIAIFVFYIVLIVIFRKVTTPVEELKGWAKSMTADQLNKPVPDFHYSELNVLANIVKSSMESVQQSVDREKKFLAYASHELRTPIAVTKANTELLKKMCDKQVGVNKQQEVLQRISRASVTMTDLTEAILWLNRSKASKIPEKPIALGSLVSQITAELSYLLQGKEVSVDIMTDDQDVLLIEPLARIVCNNLIRNAFQHTSNGFVQVKQKGSTLIILNQSTKWDSEQNNLGFGLGLELTERIIQQHGWRYKNRTIDNGHDVSIDFYPSSTTD